MSSDGRFSGQVAAVTGAANGIGAAVARRLVDEGATVMWIEAMVTATVERWGGLNIMHNNAGLAGVQRPIDETVIADWSRSIDGGETRRCWF